MEAEKGNAERMAFEKDTAGNDQRDKQMQDHAHQMDELKKAMRQKLANYEAEIEDLKRLLATKNRELQECEARELGLGLKLDSLVDSTDKLKDMENRVINIGLDKQFIKNVTEMFRLRYV